MKRIVVALLIIFCIFSSSCASKIMAKWVGHDQSELYQAMGPPTRITSDGSNGQILIYESYVNMGQDPGEIYQSGSKLKYTAPQQQGYLRTRMYYVNVQKKIYSWRWQGL